MKNQLSQIEKEIIILNAVRDFIDDMVNYQIFIKFDKITDVTLLAKTMVHQRLFNILLVDLLSKPNVQVFEISQPSNQYLPYGYLSCLLGVCKIPTINLKNKSVLTNPVQKFVNWLDTECVVENVWLPSIDTELTLRLKRISFMKICGNISKHNFLRLDHCIREIKNILKANGVSISTDQAYLVLPEFYEWFHDDIFNYHISTIAEFLNNIRWGIHEYLKPEFERIKSNEKKIQAELSFPAKCKNIVSQSMYLELMDFARTPPYMPKFEVTRYLKMRY
jgi:hypothetical protein